MFVFRTRTALMAGAATLSLTVGTFASEYSNVIVFGDRYLDAGQYVSPEAVFAEEDDELGDRRERFTNRDATGGDVNTWATRVSVALGNGVTQPSQPATLPGEDAPASGLNYAAGFSSAFDVLNSVLGTSQTSGIRYRDEDGNVVDINQTSRPGFLADVARSGWAADSIVLMNGGQRDIRFLANVERNTSDEIVNQRSFFVENSATREARSEFAAETIAVGAVALRDAGAGLVAVANLFDMGATPEIGGELDSAQQGLADLNVARTAALAADPLAVESDSDLRARAVFEGIIANPDAVAQYRTEGTNFFNAELAAQLDGETGIVILDQNALISAVIADPNRFGLSSEYQQDVDCFDNSILYPCNEVTGGTDELLFLNGLDLTDAGQQILADHAVAVINAPVQVSGTPFVAIASGRAVANTGLGRIAPEHIARRGWEPFVSAGIGQSNWNPVSGEGQQGALPITGVVGVSYSFGNGVAIGAAGAYQGISNAKSEYATGYDGDAIHGTVFAGADFGRVFGSAAITAGTVDFDSVERRSNIGGGTIVNSGSTDADVFGASIEVGLRALTSGTVAAGPIASLDHWSADVSGYSEDGELFTATSYDGFDGSSTRGSFGMFLEAGDLADADMPAVFRMKALYTREFETDGIDVTARTATSPNNSFTREGRSGQTDSITLGAQVSYDFGPVVTTLGYDARIGESDDHYGRLDVSIPINGGVK